VRAAGIRGHRKGDRLALQEFDLVGLDQAVDGEGAAGLFLAVEAMTAMDEQRFAFQPIAHLTAGTSAFDRE